MRSNRTQLDSLYDPESGLSLGCWTAQGRPDLYKLHEGCPGDYIVVVGAPHRKCQCDCHKEARDAST